jgi:glycine/D-amino acid oxidase-like deaminating enzyme
VIGAGVVGLAVARQLAGRDGTTTLLIERHGAVGTETSSRNSEVRNRKLLHTALPVLWPTMLTQVRRVG